MPKVEPAGLGDLHVDIPTALADRQQATAAQGIDRVPFPRRPGSRFLTGREPLQKRALPFVQGGPPMHEHQPTPQALTLYRAERVAIGQWEPPGTFLGLPAASTGMTVKQPKGHHRRPAPHSHPSQQVTGPPGLFRDI